MAWRAFVPQAITATSDGLLSVVIQYYDDADSANTGVGLQGPGNGTAAASTDLISISNHGLVAGNRVIFTTLTGGAGLTLNVPYYVIAAGLTTGVFSVSQESAGTAVNITTNYSAVTAFKVTSPANVLWAKIWNLPIDATTQQLQDAVVQEGAKARAWVTAQTTARASVSVGTSIAIP